MIHNEANGILIFFRNFDLVENQISSNSRFIDYLTLREICDIPLF